MLHKIREFLKHDSEVINCIVECDETFVGGKNKNRHKDKKVAKSQGRSFKNKTPVFGMFHHNTGKIYTKVIPDTKSGSITPIIHSKIAKGTIVMSDEWGAYSSLSEDYNHQFVYHSRGEYANEDCTTNRVENFWSVFKRTLNGSYISVSRKYMQNYANEVSFRFNNRTNTKMFNTLFNMVATA
jgi:transposase-like protein